MSRHAWTHVKQDAVSIDLHRTLVGVEAPPKRVWEVCSERARKPRSARSAFVCPSFQAQLLIVGLHAAQHGVESEKTMEDLRRAVDRYNRAEWTLADRTRRESWARIALLGARLCLLDEGRELAQTLRLPRARLPNDAIALDDGPTYRAWLRSPCPAPRPRPRVVHLGKAFPPPAFMRDWRPLARRGNVGLVLAYGYRLGWLAHWAPERAHELSGRKPQSKDRGTRAEEKGHVVASQRKRFMLARGDNPTSTGHSALSSAEIPGREEASGRRMSVLACLSGRKKWPRRANVRAA